MTALLLFMLLAQSSACDANLSTLSIDDYRHCILSVQVERHEAFHTDTVGPMLTDHGIRVAILENWQFYIKIILGIGGAGGIGFGANEVRLRRRNNR